LTRRNTMVLLSQSLGLKWQERGCSGELNKAYPRG